MRVLKCAALIAGGALVIWLVVAERWTDTASTPPIGDPTDVSGRAGTGLMTRHDEAPSSPGGSHSGPGAADSAREAAHLAGLVLLPDGHTLAGAGIDVEIMTRWQPAQRWRARTDATGTFRCEFTLGAGETPPDTVLVQGYDRVGLKCTDAAAVTKAPSGWPSAVLRLREGSMVGARAVDPSGEPVPGAEVLISEFGSRGQPQQRRPAEAVRILDRVVTADGQGFLQVVVRAGTVELRAGRPGGPRGAMTRLTLEPGERADAGDVVCGGESVRLVLRVTDGASGAPVPDAWVRLSDRTVRLGRPDTNRTWHFRTGADGTVELPAIAREVLPVTVAVGSPTYRFGATQIGAGAESGTLDVALGRRPSTTLELAPGGGGIWPDIPRVEWSAESLDREPQAPRPRRGRLDATDVLREIFGEQHFDALGGGRYRFSVAKPGRYAVHARIPGVGAVSATLAIEEGGDDIHRIDVPAGRPVTLRFQRPQAGLDEHVWRPVLNGLYLYWGPARKDRHRWNALDEPEISFWLPSARGPMGVASELAPAAPIRGLVLDTDAASEGVLSVAFDQIVEPGHGWLELQLRGPEGPLALEGIKLRVRGTDAATGRDLLTSIVIATDATGKARLPLVPGRYTVRKLARTQAREEPLDVEIRRGTTRGAELTMAVR